MVERFERAQPAPPLEERFLALELFAVNFHETFDLSPLLVQMRNDIARLGGERLMILETRLDDLALKIRARELQILEAAGAIGVPFVLALDRGAARSETLVLPDGKEWRFEVRVAEVHPAERTRVVEVVMAGDAVAIAPGEGGALPRGAGRTPEAVRVDWMTDVDNFRFPMSHHASLPDGLRCAVMLDGWDVPRREARLQLLCYPGDFRSATRAAQLLERIDGLSN